jgi:hypothetical protein
LRITGGSFAASGDEQGSNENGESALSNGSTGDSLNCDPLNHGFEPWAHSPYRKSAPGEFGPKSIRARHSLLFNFNIL